MVPADGQTTATLTLDYDTLGGGYNDWQGCDIEMETMPIGTFEETNTWWMGWFPRDETQVKGHVYSQVPGEAVIWACSEYYNGYRDTITFYNIAFNPDDFPKYVGVGDNLNLRCIAGVRSKLLTKIYNDDRIRAWQDR